MNESDADASRIAAFSFVARSLRRTRVRLTRDSSDALHCGRLCVLSLASAPFRDSALTFGFGSLRRTGVRLTPLPSVALIREKLHSPNAQACCVLSSAARGLSSAR